MKFFLSHQDAMAACYLDVPTVANAVTQHECVPRGQPREVRLRDFADPITILVFEDTAGRACVPREKNEQVWQFRSGTMTIFFDRSITQTNQAQTCFFISRISQGTTGE